MSFDVLKEAALGFEKSNAICNKRPKMPRVLLTFTLTGCTEGLAWVTPSEDVHASVK
jgi:hypothetical protein